MAREARENGGVKHVCANLLSSCTSAFGREGASDTPPLGCLQPLTEVDGVHDSDQTAVLRAALFQNCNLPPAMWDAWRTEVAGDLGSRAGFRCGRYLDFRGSFKLSSSPHLRGGDTGLLRGILSGGVWNGFLLGFVRGEVVPCRFCGFLIVMDICFGNVLISPLFIFVRALSFMIS